MKKQLIRGFIGGLALLGLAVPSAQAMTAQRQLAASTAGSIVYQSGGNIWLASPNGSNRRRVTRDGTPASPYQYATQANNGTIAAIKNYSVLYHLGRKGGVMRRITVATGPHSAISLHTLGLDPQISPNGQRVALSVVEYQGLLDPSTGATGAEIISQDINYYVMKTGKRLSPLHLAGTDLMAPSWIDNNNLLVFAPYNIAAAEVYVASFVKEGWSWFADANGDLLARQPLNHGELTRQRDKLAVIRGNDLANDWRGTTIEIYPVNGDLKSYPTSACSIKAQHGMISKVSWSPDGSTLAWSDSNGIWESPVQTNVSGCGLAPKLVIKGGAYPDWGPAR